MKIGDSEDQRSPLHMRRFNHAHTGTKARNHADSRPTLCHRVSAIYLAAPLHAQARVVSLSLRDAQSQSQGTNVSGQQVYPGRSLGHDSRATSPLSRPEQSSLWPWLVSEDTIHADLWIRLSYHVN